MENKFRAIRMDDKGEVDDVAISGDLYRLERMDDNSFWTCVYDGAKRVAFSISSDSPIKVEVIEDGLDCKDDTKEDPNGRKRT